MSLNLADLLRGQARSQPGRIALATADASLDYAAAWRRTQALAAGLRSLGVAAGDRIGLALPDTPDHLLAHFAIAAIGAVLVPIDWRWTADEQRAAADAFEARLVIGDTDDHDRRWHRLHELADTAEPGALEPVDGGERDWLISLSSGSTGRPTGALVSHRQMYERFVAQWVSLGLNADERFALTTPLCFGAGRSFAMSTLAAGATLILLPPTLAPAALVDALDAHGATATFMVPTQLRRIDALPDTGSPRLTVLRRLIVSGEALPAAQARRFQRSISAGLIGYYASSEGGGISVLRPGDLTAHAESVGRAAFRVEIEIVDTEDKPVAPGEVGRLRYRGPGVTTRQVNGEAGDRDGGWCYPGDLAWRDADGFLTLAGRSKDVIVRAGVNLYPAELEHALASVPGLSAIAVVGAPAGDRGEAVHAYYVGDVTAEELQAHCRSALAPYKQPSQWHRLDALPLTSAGKIDKQMLRALARGDAPS